MADLSPCPFCASKPDEPFENLRDDDDSPVTIWTMHHHCRGIDMWIEGSSAEECGENWNRRGAPAQGAPEPEDEPGYGGRYGLQRRPLGPAQSAPNGDVIDAEKHVLQAIKQLHEASIPVPMSLHHAAHALHYAVTSTPSTDRAQCAPKPLSEQERHAIARACYQIEHATPDNPECCFDYQLVETLLEIIKRSGAAFTSTYNCPDPGLDRFKQQVQDYYKNDPEPLDEGEAMEVHAKRLGEP